MHALTVVLSTLLALFAPLWSEVQGDHRPSRLAGSIHYAGGAWPVLVDLGVPGDGVAVMSFPALGVSRLEVSGRVSSGELALEIPYGLGAQRLRWIDGAYRTASGPADRDSIAVVLEPDPMPPPVVSEVAFRSGEVELAGALWRPGDATDRRTPLVVVGHGGGRFSRQMPEYVFWAEHLTRRGYAAFLYDKRGLGASGGSFEDASLELLTADFVAAVGTASAQPGVDPEQVGFLGASQFGWIAFRAARELEVDAMVISGAPAVDPVTLEARVLADGLRRAGVTGEAFADAMSYVRLYFAAARFPDLFEPLIALAQESRDTGWIEHVPVPADPSDQRWWGENAGFDPAEDIRSFDGPVFVAYGREDVIATPQINALRMEHLMREGKASLTLWIADEANHRLEVPSRMVDGALRFPQLAPGYLERVDAFLEKHLGRP